MCKLCAIAARYQGANQKTLAFDLSQFAAAVDIKPSSLKHERSQIKIQENQS
jgi:hypothetical protein